MRRGPPALVCALAQPSSSLTSSDGAAEVSLTDGTTRRYDLVLGADGINSKVRTAIFPDAPKPRYTGQACWRAVVPRPASMRRAAMYIGGQIKAGIVPVPKDEMYLFFLETRATPEHVDAQEWPGLLRKALAEFTGPIADIREVSRQNRRSSIARCSHS